MSKGKRRHHSGEFKARVALEAIRGTKTVAQIAADNDLHPVQVTQWKKTMLGQASEVFARGDKAGREARDHEAEKERLERKVGQLAVEVDWLSKKCKQLGIDL